MLLLRDEIFINIQFFFTLMTNSPFDDIVLNMFRNKEKDILMTLVASAVGKGEHPLVGLQNISGEYLFSTLCTQEKEIADHLKTLDKPESLAAVKNYVTSCIAQLQRVQNKPLFYGNVPFLFYAMHLAESLEQQYDNQTASFLKGVMTHTILEQTCPTLAEELPPDLTAIFHHHIYDEVRTPSEREKKYAVPSYVVATYCPEDVSRLYRFVDEGVAEIGKISHTAKVQNILLLRRKPRIRYVEDKEFLRFTAISDYQLQCMSVYALQTGRFVQALKPRLFTLPTTIGMVYIPLTNIKNLGALFAFAIDEHYRAAVVARIPQQRIKL